MLLLGNMLAHMAQFGTQDDQAAILKMATTTAARAIGIERDYGLEVGKWADLVVTDCYEVADVLSDIPTRSWVIKRGKITVITDHSCKILRHPKHQASRCQKHP